MSTAKSKKITISSGSMEELQKLLNGIKQKGDHCKIDDNLLVNWIITDYQRYISDKKIEEIYYRFLDENLFSQSLFKSNTSLIESNKKIKEMIRKRKNALKNRSKYLKKQVQKIKPQTSTSEQRKVGFE